MITSPAIEYWRTLKNQVQDERYAQGYRNDSDALVLLWNIEQSEIEQMIASLYPGEFPAYPPDWHTADLCVGEHTYMSLIDKLINEVLELRKQNEERTTDS